MVDLWRQKTYACGITQTTCRGWLKDLVFNQQTIRKTSDLKFGENMQQREIVATTWQDKQTVSVLSTGLQPVMGSAVPPTRKGKINCSILHVLAFSIHVCVYVCVGVGGGVCQCVCRLCVFFSLCVWVYVLFCFSESCHCHTDLQLTAHCTNDWVISLCSRFHRLSMAEKCKQKRVK